MCSGPDQHQHSLKQTADAHQLKLLTEDLQGRRPGANQTAVKITGLDQVWKDIEAPRNRLRDRKCDGNDSIKEADLWECPAFDVSEPLKQSDQSKELHAGDNELRDRADEKRSAILHLAAAGNARVSKV